MTASSPVTGIGEYQIVGALDAPGREMYAALLNQQSFVLVLFDVEAAATEAMLVEVKRSARLRSNTLLPVVDAFRYEGRHVAVFEAVEGMSLLRLLRSLHAQEEQLSDGAITYIGCRLMEALAIAHEATDPYGKTVPLVHGELGPHQMFISWNGQPRLMGVGLLPIFVLAAEQGKQPSWAVDFVAPEVRTGAAITVHSNAYSAALLLWSMYSDRPVPDAAPPTPLATLRPDLPADIVRRIDQALHPQPRDRVRCRLLAETLRKHMHPSDPSELAERAKALRSMVPLGTPVPPEAMPPFQISSPPNTIREVAITDDAPTAPSHSIAPRIKKLTPYPPLPPRITVEEAASLRPTRKLRAASKRATDDEHAAAPSVQSRAARHRPASAGLPAPPPTSAPPTSGRPHSALPAVTKLVNTPPSSKRRRNTRPMNSRALGPSSRTTLPGQPKQDGAAVSTPQPASARTAVTLPKRGKAQPSRLLPKRSTLPSVPPLDAPFEEGMTDINPPAFDFDAPTAQFDLSEDAGDDDQPTAKSRVAADLAGPPSSDRRRRITRKVLSRYKSHGALPIPQSERPRSRDRLPATGARALPPRPAPAPVVAPASRPPRASSPSVAPAATASVVPVAAVPAAADSAPTSAPANDARPRLIVHDGDATSADSARLEARKVAVAELSSGVFAKSNDSVAPVRFEAAAAINDEPTLRSDPPVPPTGRRAKPIPWHWWTALVVAGAGCFAMGVWVGRSDGQATSVAVKQRQPAPAACVHVDARATAPAVTTTAAVAPTATLVPPPAASSAAVASPTESAPADASAPSASAAPAPSAVAVASGASSVAAPSDAAAATGASAVAPAAIVADLSKLKPGEAYLVVTQPPQADAHVYVNGALMGRPATALVVPCDRPKNIRLGTHPLRRWYGRGRAVVITCQQVNTTTINTALP